METCTSIRAMRELVGRWKARHQRIAFVPTMGNLHAGHMALVEHARAGAERVVVSIFVNPLQFDEDADFDAYPRTVERDKQLLSDAGVDALLLPEASDIYPLGQQATTRVVVPDLGDILEGACRPGHFTGVATVVNKLFNIVRPDIAVFGEKDYQQLMLIKRMVRELDMAIQIDAIATLREPDGLAMSSRNSRLTEEQRQQAPVLYKVLKQLAASLQRDETPYSRLESEAMRILEEQGFKPEYITIRRANDLQMPLPGDSKLVILAAARLGATRIIDNLPVVLNLNH